MNERNEKWLDEQLKSVIDSGKVNFDGEKWKRKYSAEYEALVSRAGRRPKALRFFVRIAAVVAIAAIVILFVSRRSEHFTSVVSKISEQTPAQMLSVLSLSLAYRQGGLDAVDEKCKKAFELLGQKNTNVSIGELLNESNGKKPERKEL